MPGHMKLIQTFQTIPNRILMDEQRREPYRQLSIYLRPEGCCRETGKEIRNRIINIVSETRTLAHSRARSPIHLVEIKKKKGEKCLFIANNILRLMKSNSTTHETKLTLMLGHIDFSCLQYTRSNELFLCSFFVARGE